MSDFRVWNSIGIVIGCGETWKEDLRLWENSGLSGVLNHKVVAVNRAGLSYLNPIYVWVSHHPSEFPEWTKTRKNFGGNTNYAIISSFEHPCVDKIYPHEQPPGSSCLYGVLVSLMVLECSVVVVLGCPLTHPDYFFYRDGWKSKEKFLKNRVRGFSGIVVELFGKPTMEWLIKEGGA